MHDYVGLPAGTRITSTVMSLAGTNYNLAPRGAIIYSITATYTRGNRFNDPFIQNLDGLPLFIFSIEGINRGPCTQTIKGPFIAENGLRGRQLTSGNCTMTVVYRHPTSTL